MKVLLTGGSGFVGTNLIGYLGGLSSFSHLTRSDLSEPSIVINKGSCAVVHLAGKAHDLKNVSRPEEYFEVNFGLTRKLYDAYLDSDAKKFIFVSSVKAVADSLDSELTEDTEPKPGTPYGRSKLMAEEYIMSKSLPEGKEVYILRPCMVHGSGNKGNLNLLFKFVSWGLPYPLAAFDNKRSFLSVENLCFVIKAILERRDLQSGTYNLADDTPLSTSEVVRLMAVELGRKPLLWNLSKKMIYQLAKLGDLAYLPLNSERLQKLTEDYVVSNKKIISTLGAPLPLTSKEGIIQTIRALRRSDPARRY